MTTRSSKLVIHVKTIRHTAILQADLATARQLTAEVCRRHSGLQLVPGRPRRGTLADRSQRLPVTATTGRQATYGYLELTPLDASHTQVELALVALAPTAGWRLPGVARRTAWRAERDVNAFAQALRPNRPRTAPRSHQPRTPGAGRRWRLALGTGAVTVITAAGIASSLLATHTTPVSEQAALERFREHTATPGAESEDPGDAVRTVRSESTDGSEADGSPAGGEPDQPGEQEADEPAPDSGPNDDADRESASASDQAELQSQATSDEQDERSLPQEGIYIYDTDGYEQLDTAGAHRDYPDRTTITLTHDGCGIHEHWDVADQRWGQRQTCVDADRTHLEQLTTYREFAGQSREGTFYCDDEAPANMLDHEPGTSWQLTCDSEDTRLDTHVELTAREKLQIAGHSVDAVKLVYDTTMTGNADGHQHLQRWLRPTDGLLLQERSQTEADVDGLLGPVTYTEDYEIVLADLEPRT